MDKQAVFERAVRGVLEQGAPAASSGGTCFYRLETPDGRVLKCAVGHLIPDEAYSPELEGKDASHEDVLRACGLEPRTEAARVAIAVQQAHDNAVDFHHEPFVTRFKRRAVELAAEHSLDASFLHEELVS